MKALFAALIVLIFISALQAQGENYEFDTFTVSVQNNMVLAKDVNGKVFYSRSFNNIKEFLSDLDGDSLSEFCVMEIKKADKNTFYKVYVYNTVDTFALADSLESLNLEPYSVYDEENEKEIFIVGNTDCIKLARNKEETITAALDCYEYDGSSFNLINNQIYDIFMRQNEALIDSLDDFYADSDSSCEKSQSMKSLIAAMYLNYKNAAEDSISLHFLNKYYFCNDILDFKSKLNALLKVKQHETKLE